MVVWKGEFGQEHVDAINKALKKECYLHPSPFRHKILEAKVEELEKIVENKKV